MSNNYNPSPMDLRDVVLPENLKPLIEKLAKNVHEIWAAERIKDGWSYGTMRDDLKKETPCLVEYDALPEEEKKYDRETVLGVLKMILKSGYVVSQKYPVDSDLHAL